MTTLLTRKDVARLLGCSYRTVARSERAWGLEEAVVRVNARVVRYRRARTIRILIKIGLLEREV